MGEWGFVNKAEVGKNEMDIHILINVYMHP